LVFRSPEDESAKTAQDHETRPATSSAELPVPANEQPPGAPANTNSDADQAAHVRAAEEDKKLGRGVPRKGPVHPAPVNNPTRDPKSEPRETAVPAPRPAPSPAPTDDFEKNPYLRR